MRRLGSEFSAKKKGVSKQLHVRPPMLDRKAPIPAKRTRTVRPSRPLIEPKPEEDPLKVQIEAMNQQIKMLKGPGEPAGDLPSSGIGTPHEGRPPPGVSASGSPGSRHRPGGLADPYCRTRTSFGERPTPKFEEFRQSGYGADDSNSTYRSGTNRCERGRLPGPDWSRKDHNHRQVGREVHAC